MSTAVDHTASEHRLPEPRMKATYRTEVRDALKDELGLPNVMMVPKLEKIVINMGVGAALTNRANLDGALADLETDHCRPEAGCHQGEEVDCRLQAP